MTRSLSRRVLVRGALAAAASVAGAAVAPAAFAQAPAWPTRPVKFVVPFPAGGATDLTGRLLAGKLAEVWGPDGYTISFTLNNHAINQALYPKLPFDTEKDLRGVTLIGALPQLLAAHPSAPANTLQEFLQQSKLSDSKLKSYASGGVGSPGHFAAAYLESLAGVDLVHVPYRGAGPAIADVLGNQVPYILSTLTGLLPHIKSGKLKAIAITSSQRSSLLPNVPTIAEAGFPGYDMDTWIGTFVPKATPDSVVKIIHEATLEALKSPAVREKIENQAGRVFTAGPADLDAIVTKDIRALSKIVKERGIKPE